MHHPEAELGVQAHWPYRGLPYSHSSCKSSLPDRPLITHLIPHLASPGFQGYSGLPHWQSRYSLSSPFLSAQQCTAVATLAVFPSPCDPLLFVLLHRPSALFKPPEFSPSTPSPPSHWCLVDLICPQDLHSPDLQTEARPVPCAPIQVYTVSRRS